MTRRRRLYSIQVSRMLLAANVVMAIVYFAAIAFWFEKGNTYLFALFVAGEVFHLWQSLTYVYTIWSMRTKPQFDSRFEPSVDIYITVAGEPVEIVEETVTATKAIDYSNKHIYILNDGYVAKKDNWKEVERLAQRLGVGCITRRVPGGAKAGNINNALSHTGGEYVAIFDADHVPHPTFLKKMMGYFIDENMAFVQSPQYYHNQDTNYITGGAWEQQELFFGPIMNGKNHLGSAFMCGTNMVVKRSALVEVGGMCETNIAEDFLTSLLLHERGYKSYYVGEVLAEGLAPEDFLSYYKQQYRWARGSLEVIFTYNPLFNRGLTARQKIQYLASASYYLSGAVVLMNAVLPIIFFFTGLVVFNISTMSLAAVFIPYIFFSLYALQLSSNFNYTFRALAFSMSSWYMQLQAVGSILLRRKPSFAVTSKQQVSGNFLYLVAPQIVYVVLAIVGGAFALWRFGATASVVTNIAWAVLNIGIVTPYIYAASPWGGRTRRRIIKPVRGVAGAGASPATVPVVGSEVRNG